MHMNEDFLHYLWKYKKFNSTQLSTTEGEELMIKRSGDHNQQLSGPDFFNAQLIIGEQRWAGTVEIHIKSSDWYVHHHETDPAYENVILHVVWEDDVEVFRKNNTRIPTLQLKEYIAAPLLATYQKLFETSENKWIPCETSIPTVSQFTIAHWQERLYLERLEEKAAHIKPMLAAATNDWEAVLFILVAKNFGLHSNQESFLSLARSIPYSVVRKCSHDLHQLEALFFGQSGLLQDLHENPYAQKLKHTYTYLATKFSLSNQGVLPFHFFRLRPANFPTIRIAQLAMLYHQHQQLFAKLMAATTLTALSEICNTATSQFWETHYTFHKTTTHRPKKMTKAFVELLIINTIVPLKYMYNTYKGAVGAEELLQIMSQLAPERNRITAKFETLGVPMEDAVHSQAVLQLKKVYCDSKKCLQCAIGNKLLDQRGK